MPVTWEPIPQHTSFTLWDIDREFQQANEAYDQWQARQRRRRTTWACISMKHQDDALGRVLRLGRQVQKIMETGKELFGARFEQGDSKCHTILSAQLLRLQYEIRQPLFDSALSPAATPIDYNEIIKTAKSIRRTCLTALKEQFTRFESRNFVPLLPPPRFRVDYCPFADQLRKDLRTSKASNLRTQKLRPNDLHDDRELCPHCDACISVTAHSGLPDYRSILFTSHTALPRTATTDRATFACNSCYKTFDDSYAFLDHVFQKQIGSDRSCMRKSTYSFTSTSSFSSYEDNAESDPVLVEQCLKNCLRRELTRVRTQKNLKNQVVVTTKEIKPEPAVSQNLVIRNPDPEPEPTSIKSLRRSSSRPFRHQNV